MPPPSTSAREFGATPGLWTPRGGTHRHVLLSPCPLREPGRRYLAAGARLSNVGGASGRTPNLSAGRGFAHLTQLYIGGVDRPSSLLVLRRTVAGCVDCTARMS
jgi:hypothetical protein